MNAKWQPIETAPNDCFTPFLIYCPSANRGTETCEVVVRCCSEFPWGTECVFYTNGGPNGGEDLFFKVGDEPKFWMPLPEAPK